jgi:cell division protein FtsI/penicillin-binding protein 2
MIVERIRDQNGDIVYQSRFTVLNRAISPESSGVIKQLMLETIASGTCRKAFRGYRKDTVLSKLNIGGKTGTISSKDRHAHYDWFVGFAEEKGGTEQIVISAMVAHGKRAGIRAKEYARMAIKEYFRNYFAKQGAKKNDKQHSGN